MASARTSETESMESTQEREEELSWRPPARTGSAVRSSRQASPVRASKAATQVMFKSIDNRPDAARVQLILCNISDRTLFYRLRCSATTRVSALPGGSGHVQPRASSRLILTWHRPKSVKKWRSAPQPRMVLLTKYAKTSHRRAETNSTRLIGHISEHGFCTAHEPPTTQLLLDAASAIDAESELDEEADNGWMNSTSDDEVRMPPGTAAPPIINKHGGFGALDSWENVAIGVLIIIFVIHFFTTYVFAPTPRRIIKLSQHG